MRVLWEENTQRLFSYTLHTELVAICDPFSNELSEQYNVPNFTELKNLIENVAIDGIIIANPNHYHVSTAIDCIEHGIPCLLEKPLASTIEEGMILIKEQIKTKIPILVGHHRRHNKIIQQAREIIQKGIIGNINTFNVLWMVRKPDSYFEIDWHRKEGAGVLVTNLIHDLDLMRYLNGEIESVQAFSSNRNRKLEIEDTLSIIVRFKNGALGSLLASDASVSPWGWDLNSEENKNFYFSPEQNCYHISGMEGALSIPSLEYWRYPLNQEKSWTEKLIKNSIPPDKEEDVYMRQLKHFIEVIDGHVTPICSPQDAIKNIQLIESIRKAIQEEKIVYVDSLVN